MNTEHGPQGIEDSTHLTEQDWQELQPRDRVYVASRGNPWTAGTVDQVMASSGMFWVWLDEGRGRVLVHPDGQTAVVSLDAKHQSAKQS